MYLSLPSVTLPFKEIMLKKSQELFKKTKTVQQTLVGGKSKLPSHVQCMIQLCMRVYTVYIYFSSLEGELKRKRQFWSRIRCFHVLSVPCTS